MAGICIGYINHKLLSCVVSGLIGTGSDGTLVDIRLICSNVLKVMTLSATREHFTNRPAYLFSHFAKYYTILSSNTPLK